MISFHQNLVFYLLLNKLWLFVIKKKSFLRIFSSRFVRQRLVSVRCCFARKKVEIHQILAEANNITALKKTPTSASDWISWLVLSLFLIYIAICELVFNFHDPVYYFPTRVMRKMLKTKECVSRSFGPIHKRKNKGSFAEEGVLRHWAIVSLSNNGVEKKLFSFDNIENDGPLISNPIGGNISPRNLLRFGLLGCCEVGCVVEKADNNFACMEVWWAAYSWVAAQ